MARPFYPEGRYKCRILKQALSEAGTGTPQIVLRFTVLETDLGEPVNQQYERTIFRALTPKTMPYVIEDLKTLGYTRDSFRYIDPEEPNHHSFAGQEFTAFCQHKEDQNGDPREQWGIVNGSSGGLEVKPLESKKLRELDNLFGKQLRAELGGSAPAPRAAKAAAVKDDDIPF